MAKIVSYGGNTMATLELPADLELSAEEVLDIRKTALMAAVQVYHQAGRDGGLIRDILYTARKFEEHIQRGIDIDG
jgi:hypothetical protein